MPWFDGGSVLWAPSRLVLCPLFCFFPFICKFVKQFSIDEAVHPSVRLLDCRFGICPAAKGAVEGGGGASSQRRNPRNRPVWSSLDLLPIHKLVLLCKLIKYSLRGFSRTETNWTLTLLRPTASLSEDIWLLFTTPSKTHSSHVCYPNFIFKLFSHDWNWRETARERNDLDWHAFRCKTFFYL